MGLLQKVKEFFAPTYVMIEGIALPESAYKALVRDGHFDEGMETRPFSKEDSFKLDRYLREHGSLPAGEINDILVSSD